MSNLLSLLISSSSTLDAYGRVLETAQNNVANASTPGYAKQRVELYALPFDPQSGSTGGVRAGLGVYSSPGKLNPSSSIQCSPCRLSGCRDCMWRWDW